LRAARDALTLIRDILERALADLARHPNSEAADIARRIGEDDPVLVFRVLKDGERQGRCERQLLYRDGPWLWRASHE
jgi:hypothetical protein